MQKEELSRGGGETKTLDFETPFGYFRKVAMSTQESKRFESSGFLDWKKGDGKCSWWGTPFEAFSVKDPPPLSASLFHPPAFFVF